MLIYVIETGIAIFYLVSLWQAYWPQLQEQQAYEREQREQYNKIIDGKSESINSISPLAYALCEGDFNIVHEPSGETNSAIMQCQAETNDIYELSNQQEHDGYHDLAYAVYYGVSKDKIVEKYFPDARYLYKNLYNTSYPEEVSLLLPAESIEDVIAKYSEPLYNYIKEKNEEYTSDLQIEIFYNENLDDVDTLKDYIVLASTHHVVTDWLPHGNGRPGPNGENFIFFEPTEPSVLNDLAENPGSYSDQTRNAIKYHPHLLFNVTDGDSLTLAQLQAKMRSSQLCQDQETLGWSACSQ